MARKFTHEYSCSFFAFWIKYFFRFKFYILFKVLRFLFLKTDRALTSLNWNNVLVCPLNLGSNSTALVNLLLAVFKSGAVVYFVVMRAASWKVHDRPLFNWSIFAHLALGSRLFAVWTGVLVFVDLWHWSWLLGSGSELVMTWLSWLRQGRHGSNLEVWVSLSKLDSCA